MGTSHPLEAFQPAVRSWFEGQFEGGPTEAQTHGWPAIAAGRDTLIAAPTGSGKTLAAFLVFIDRLLREGAAGPLGEGVDVLYVSPLKALATDIHQNLERPLAEIRDEALRLGQPAPEIRSLVRTGDTPASARAAMLRRPPHFLITTPESLYLLVTAERSRELLRGVRTVIVDEIHAVAGSERGSHLALTLERLDALCDQRPVRVGISATQKPIDRIARLLVGAGPERSEEDGSPRCAIVDRGHRRALDLAIEVPESDLEAVASLEQWAEILDRIAAHVEQHRTTLVFVNTRRLAERLAHLLAERLGEEAVAAHHGSLSKERRQRVETRLRAGDLRALVATASLELGIDIGPVDLVCQIGSPRSIATFLQRVGRSGHALGATPRGRLYPTTRDELVECAGLVRAVVAGRLDRIHPPEAPLDILAQQIVAACAADDWTEDALFDCMRGAAPYAVLSRADFDEVVELLAEGIPTGRGRRAAYLHRDRVNGVLRGRRGARLAALTSGGAIPEKADYRVVADPDDTFVGTVDEDWAIESMAGDIFLLGTTSWRIRRVESGVVRVGDAKGLPPTIPFWFGEAPARTGELSDEVSQLRAEVDARLATSPPAAIVEWLAAAAQLEVAGAEQVVRYLAAGRDALGVLPTQTDLVLERFFDETGGMQLVVHAPFGARINRALGLGLRKRFCRRFDFELQAAASDDAVVLSLGPHQSFPLEEVPHYLKAGDARAVVAQAMLVSPMFAARWRWNLGRALTVLRRRGGKKVPPPIQRMEADDLMAAVFPGLAACQENQTGPVEIPDHFLVRQTIDDCLHEAADIEGLEALLEQIESGAVRVHCRDTTEPSPLAHEILNGKPYTFLDDAPLEERRTRAVAMRRGLPESTRDLGALDADAIARVRDEVRPEPRDAEELHDLLLGCGVCRPQAAWTPDFERLCADGRAARLFAATGELWFARERRAEVVRLFPAARLVPDPPLPPALADRAVEHVEEAASLVVGGHLETSGPCTLADLVAATGLAEPTVEIALARLEAEGALLRGRFDPGADVEQVCARRLLARIHRYTQERLRREIEPVSAQDFLRFLLRWQHVAPGTQLEGRRGVLAVLEQLQGFELAAGAWEDAVLPARVAHYRPEWLDELCLSGELAWGRCTLRAVEEPEGEDPVVRRGGASPSRATPLTFAVREDLPWLWDVVRGDDRPARPGPGAAADVLACLETRGALFLPELVRAVGRVPLEVEEGLWDLVARGCVTADSFQAVRALLAGRQRETRRPLPRRRRGRRAGRGAGAAGGRWSVWAADIEPLDREGRAEALAEQLLARWGVVFRDLVAREHFAVPWRDLVRALRRMEDRGTVRGGRFVTGFVGEQFALPGAVEALRRVRKLPRDDETVRLSGSDPLNLVGILTPGPRIPALRTQTVLYRDGAPDPALVRELA